MFKIFHIRLSESYKTRTNHPDFSFLYQSIDNCWGKSHGLFFPMSAVNFQTFTTFFPVTVHIPPHSQNNVPLTVLRNLGQSNQLW